MQKITLSTITTFLQQGLLLLPTAALYYYLCKSNPMHTSSWLLIMASLIFINAYTIDIASRNLLDTIQQTLWMFYALLQSQSFTSSFHFAALGIISVINPSQFIVFLLRFDSEAIRRKIVWLFAGIVIGSVISFVNDVDSKYYIELYFPETMQPQFNLQWMLYACAFTRFVKLYQILFMILPFIAAYLIRSLRFPIKLQLVLLTFFRIYSSYKCSQFSLIANMVLCAFILKDYLSSFVQRCKSQKQEIESMQNKVIIVKTLTIFTIIVNITFFPLNKALLHEYLNGFRVNFGYVFLFSSIFWGINAINLTQISLLQSQLKQNQNKYVQKSKQN